MEKQGSKKNHIVAYKENINNDDNFNQSIITNEVIKNIQDFIRSLGDAAILQPFIRNVKEDGKVVTKIVEGDIVANILIGREIGLSPIESLSYGLQLNGDSVQKINLGKHLNLDLQTSLNDIHIFNTSVTRQLTLGINITEAILSANKIKFEIIEDYVPVKSYVRLDTNSIITNYNPEYHFIANDVSPQKAQELIKEKGLLGVKEITTGIRTTAQLERDGKIYKLSYTLQEAIDAGLKSGTKTDGSISEGKDTWTKYPKDLMRKTAITKLARLYCNDLLKGLYIPEEIGEQIQLVTDIIEQENNLIEAEVVSAN